MARDSSVDRSAACWARARAGSNGRRKLNASVLSVANSVSTAGAQTRTSRARSHSARWDARTLSGIAATLRDAEGTPARSGVLGAMAGAELRQRGRVEVVGRRDRDLARRARPRRRGTHTVLERGALADDRAGADLAQRLAVLTLVGGAGRHGERVYRRPPRTRPRHTTAGIARESSPGRPSVE